MINLYLGIINRSGGSLFCRLLDGHPDIASYPKEVSFPDNHMIAPDIERIAEEVGQKRMPLSVEDIIQLCIKNDLQIKCLTNTLKN